jgi:hypothetical protein
MTIPATDQTPPFVGAKAGFVTALAVAWAVIGVADVAVGNLRAAMVAAAGPDPLVGTDVLYFAVLLIALGLMYYPPSAYRRRLTGTRWVGETFIAMSAACAIGFLISRATVRAYQHTLSRLRDGSVVLLTVEVAVAVGVVTGGMGVGAEWLRARQVARRARATRRAMPR